MLHTKFHGNPPTGFFKIFLKVFTIHLFKVISERFQSHFSEYALMILK